MALREMKRYAFTRANIEYAPEESGVYVLWDGAEAVYIGRASREQGIKNVLLRHLDGTHGGCTAKCSHYSWEITLWEAARETELLAEFIREHLREPRCHAGAAK